jgi:hypothetical protein
VKPDHARELVVAAQVGKILLTLRRPDEKDEEFGGEEVTPIGDILRGRSKIASDPLNNSNPAPLIGYLKSPGSSQDARESKWTMQVMGPNGVNQFDWIDLARLPVQSNGAAAPPQSTAAPAPADLGPEPTPPTTEGATDGQWESDDAPAPLTPTRRAWN